MAPRFIDVTLTADGGGIDPNVVNPLMGVIRGDTVIWRFQGNAAGQGLRIVVPHPSLFDGTHLECEDRLDQITRRVSATVPGGAHFEYHIVRDGEKIEFVGGNTGAVIIRNPPD